MGLSDEVTTIDSLIAHQDYKFEEINDVLHGLKSRGITI